MNLLPAWFIMACCDLCWNDDGRAGEANGRAEALVGQALALPLAIKVGAVCVVLAWAIDKCVQLISNVII